MLLIGTNLQYGNMSYQFFERYTKKIITLGEWLYVLMSGRQKLSIMLENKVIKNDSDNF